jgi:MFS family permease
MEVSVLRHYVLSDHDSNVVIIAISFSSYVLGLIVSLIFFGGLADRKRPELLMLIALSISILSLVILAVFDIGFAQIVLSRALRGIAVGLALSATAIALFEILGRNTQTINIHGMLLALGLGGGGIYTLIFHYTTNEPLASGACALATIQLMLLMCLLCFGQKNTESCESKASTLPRFLLSSYWPYLGVFMAWSFVGIMLTTSSQLIDSQTTPFGSAVIIFLSVGTGGITQLFLRNKSHLPLFLSGLILANIALVLLLIGYDMRNTAVIFLSALLCGCTCLGAIYTVCIKGVLHNYNESESAILSGFFLCGYIGLGLPCIVISFISNTFGMQVALQAFLGLYVIGSIILIRESVKSGFFNNKEILY